MKKEKSELIQEALDTLQAVTLSGRSVESYVAELFENIRNLEEENKKLKEFKTKREESMFYFKALAERVEPINSKEAEELQKYKKLFERLYREELYYLEEENKKLNIKVASLEGEIKGLNSVIDKLHKEIEEQGAEGGGLFDEIDYRKREAKRLGWKPNK